VTRSPSTESNLGRTAFELKRMLEKKPEICPICRLVTDSIKQYVDYLFYENVNDSSVREGIRDAHGFCRYHSQLISNQADALGSAIILQDVLTNDLREIDGSTYEQTSEAPGPLARFFDGSSQKRDSPVCPICTVEHERDEIAIDSLLQGLEDPKLDQLFRQSQGLCLPHFRLAFSRAGAGDAWKTILEIERQALHTLADELGELAKKYDYRATEKPTGKEAGSWRRALNATSSWVQN
jgi:hypothetical protein